MRGYPNGPLFAALATFATLAGGCDSGASPDPGVTALMRLSGTGVQFVPGTLTTDPMADAPTMQAISISTNVVFPGATGRPLSGSALGSHAVLIALDGDSGHWIVPSGQPDTETLGAFDFSATLSVSPLLPLDPAKRSLLFRAVDVDGNVGPPLSLDLKVRSLGAADGQQLVVTVEWDTEADLDLKLRVPNVNDPSTPIDVWTKHRVALPQLGNSDPPYTDDDVKTAAGLDYDSNANCVLDGLRRENVVFPAAPAAGQYEVRIDATSLCGQVAARWHAFAVANGTDLLGEAYGQVGDIDTQSSHGPATGTLAFTFQVP